MRRGVLSVTNGNEVAIATREAIPGDDLDRLEQVVLAEFRKRLDTERTARTESLQLQMKAIRQIVRYLRPDRPGATGGRVMNAEPNPWASNRRMAWPRQSASSASGATTGRRKASRR